MRNEPQIIENGAETPNKIFTSDCFAQALAVRGNDFRYLSSDEITNARLRRRRVLKFSIDGFAYYLEGTCLRVSVPKKRFPKHIIDHRLRDFAGRKDLVNALLRKRGLSISEAVVFSADAREKAEAFFNAVSPRLSTGVCVKPLGDDRGKHTYRKIRDLPSFSDAFAEVSKHYKKILVTESPPFPVYRFTLVAGRVIAIQHARPASVQGNGKDTVAELVAQKNRKRLLNPSHATYLLRLGRQQRAFLRQGGLKLHDIPLAGERIYLSDSYSLHQGADFLDVTDIVHPSYIELVERAASYLPGLILCAAITSIQNLHKSASKSNCRILEFVRDPGITTCHYPWQGQSRDAAGAVVDYLTTSPGRKVRSTQVSFSKGSSGDCLVQALSARGMPYRYLTPDEITNPLFSEQRRILTFDIGPVPYYFDGCAVRVADPRGLVVPGPLIDGPAARFVKNKDCVKLFLRRCGISVPRGAAFHREALSAAEAFFATLSASVSAGVCVKPCRGNKGRHVHVGIDDLASFRASFAEVGEHYERILIEETVPGTVYRFTSLAGRIVAVEFGRPANVEGDGVHTIAELVKIKNAERRCNAAHANSLLRLGREQRGFLGEYGLTPDHIPDDGKLVFLSDRSNLHQGGDFVDVTDAVHRSYIRRAERAISLIPGLVLCGADVIVQDSSVPASEDNYHVLELNCGPGFQTQQYPWHGQPRDVAGAIIDYLLTLTPELTFCKFPQTPSATLA